MNNGKLPVYVTDTNALFWYLSDASRLSAAADAVFRLAAAGQAHILVPAIVLAEILTLTRTVGHPIPAATLIENINQSAEFILSPLGPEQLIGMEAVDPGLRMHDRLIAAEALAHKAPVITGDPALWQTEAIDAIW
ncbi:MAG: PIN domain-containing protein [Chloroflexi bacterium]|nr:PIN domain-containing protein [Chloroflexota bacterium]